MAASEALWCQSSSRLPAQAQEVAFLALWKRYSGLRGHDVGIDPLDALVGGLGALQAAFQAMLQTHLLGEVGLHGGELVAVTDQSAGVELAVFVERDGHDGHMRGALVAVDNGGEDVLGPVALLEPVEGIAEVGVLFGPAHGVHGLGAGADEVLEAVNGVGADLLGGTGAPGVQHRLTGVRTEQDGVVVPALQVGVRGLTLTEGVLEACGEVGGLLELGAAQDGEAGLPDAATLQAQPDLGHQPLIRRCARLGHGTSSGTEEVDLCVLTRHSGTRPECRSPALAGREHINPLLLHVALVTDRPGRQGLRSMATAPRSARLDRADSRLRSGKEARPPYKAGRLKMDNYYTIFTHGL